MSFQATERKYRQIIEDYLLNQNDGSLYRGKKLSLALIDQQVTPEEVVRLHRSIMTDYKHSPEQMIAAFDVLLEVMTGYGHAYRDHQMLRSEQQALKNEIEVAANMQRTLLKTSIPQVAGLDIGAISVPARLMNGDYHHFVIDENYCVGIAIADVIGKGIPAALSMSMIKYAMDSLRDDQHFPGILLESLNRVVERNVDPSMFITMCYGVYNPRKHTFRYATAGHEPGLHYIAKKKTYKDFSGRGLLLGMDQRTTYEEFEFAVEKGDMIILLSDGVTEWRTKEGMIERNDVTAIIHKYKHLSAQEIVAKVYKKIACLQDFNIRDDFTLLILKRIN